MNRLRQASNSFKMRWMFLTITAVALGCTPTVKVEPPSEPIVVNLNVKIEHEVRVRVEKDVDDLFEEDEGLF